MVYPALNLDLKRFTPSHFIALDDPLLSHKVLKICSKAYLEVDGKFKFPPEKDPFISPSYLSDEVKKNNIINILYIILLLIKYRF